MIDLVDLSVHRAGRPVFTHLHFRLAASEQLVIIGPSGCGKTTLLAVLAGLLRPGLGKAQVGELDFAQAPQTSIDAWRAKNLGYVPQVPHLISAINCLDNLALRQRLAGQPENREANLALLRRLGLADKCHERPARLSRGEQQRVALARAFCIKPRMILADEPTANLDDENTAKVLAMLSEEAHQCKACLIVTTHDQRTKQAFEKQLNFAKLTHV